MDIVTVDTLIRLARWHGWIPLLSIVVGGFIRLSKSDAKVAWFPNFIKPENRPLWALGMSLMGGVLEQAFAGGTALEAVIGGLIAGNTAIAGHEVLSKIAQKIQRRRSMPPPSSPANDWEDDSLRPPPPTSSDTHVARAVPYVVGLLVLTSTGCAARGAICQAIDLASEVCPLILVKLADGGTEAIPKEQVAALAVQVRAARMADGGAP